MNQPSSDSHEIAIKVERLFQFERRGIPWRRPNAAAWIRPDNARTPEMSTR